MIPISSAYFPTACEDRSSITPHSSELIVVGVRPQRLGDAGQGAAGADGADEAVDLAAGLAPRSPGRCVCTWASRLATLSNWLAQTAPAGSFASSSSAKRPEYFT